MRRVVALRLLLGFVSGLAGGATGAEASDALPGLKFGGLEFREVRVYVPPGGSNAGTPLLVALDGQNMAAWRLEEAVAALAAAHRTAPPLVVAIPAGRDRIEEYGLAGTPDYAGRGRKAAEFQRFVLTEVLPAVRRRYTVTPDPVRTGVMGASLGGLAAFDLAWHHPETFGFAGMFSGSFWWRGDDSSPAAQQASRLVHQLVHATARPPRLHLWFSAGTKEETSDRDHNGVIDAIQDTTELLDALERHSYRRDADLRYVEIPDGRHNEATWAGVLPDFLGWALPPAR